MPSQARLDVTGALRQSTNELPCIPSKLLLNPALFQVFINHAVQLLIQPCVNALITRNLGTLLLTLHNSE